MHNKQFSLANYEDLLKSSKSILRVKDYRLFNVGLILRHDIDFSIDLAFEFSRIEKRNSVVSTYYILMTSDLYNPFSITSQEMIKSMIADGFEIGLHFDPTVYGEVSDYMLEKYFIKEVKTFERVFDTKIYSYSLHNPSVHGKYPNFKNYINAYNDEIFNDECYISDSMFSFRGKDPIEFIKKSEKRLVQFLTHPVQYFSEGKISYEKQMNKIINNYYKKFDKMFQVNDIYKEQKENYNIELNIQFGNDNINNK